MSQSDQWLPPSAPQTPPPGDQTPPEQQAPAPVAPPAPPQYGQQVPPTAGQPVPPQYGQPAAPPAQPLPPYGQQVPPPFYGQPAPQYGQYAPPQQQPYYGQPGQPGQPGQYPPPGYQAPPAGWTPPPKPGLIPLRPLPFGTLLAAAFQVLRRNPRPTFGFSLLVNSAVMVLTIIVVGIVSFFAFSRISSASSQDAEAIAAGGFTLVAISAIIPVVLSLVVSALLQGIVSLEVARATLGEKLTLRGLWRHAKGRIGALIGWSLLVTAAVIVVLIVLALVITLIIALGGTVGIVIGIILGILAFLAIAAAGVWLGTKLVLVPSGLMIEKLPLRAAIARSWSLTNGYFWRSFGTIALVSVIVQIASSIISTPLSFVFGMLVPLINPQQDPTGLIIGVIVLYVVTIGVSLIFSSIAAVVQSSTAALIYVDLRMRKEGFDLELTRFVEARQRGDASVPDPFLPPAPRVMAATPPTDSPWA